MVQPTVDSRPGRVEAALAEYERPLLGYARRFLGDEETARDVVQDVFLRLCREPMGLEDPRLKPWLYRVCRNRAIDVLRKDGRMRVLDDGERLVTDTPRPDTRAAQADEAQRLVACVRALPAPQQEVVWLRFRGGLSYRQIADVTRHSVSHVGVLLHEAMATLRARMGDAAAVWAAEDAS